jgi:hypothetical protein
LAAHITSRYGIKLSHQVKMGCHRYFSTSINGGLELAALAYRDATMLSRRKFSKFIEAVNVIGDSKCVDRVLLEGCRSIVEDCNHRLSRLFA